MNSQPKELFDKWTKYAIVICNQFYDKKYVALGNLPAVVDDFKNAKHTVKLMGILPENTFEMKDVSYIEIEEKFRWLCWRVKVQTKVLTNTTGILGIRFMQQGLFWTVLRPNAMKLVAPFDSVTIDLSLKDQ